jgi:PST family polysaccharide transporter
MFFEGFIKNFSWLLLARIFIQGTPILIVPILINRIGMDKYGLVIFVQSIMYYFALLVDFGFDTTGVKWVSEFRANSVRLSKIFSAITGIKVIFYLISLSIIVLSSLIIPFVKMHLMLFFFSSWVCLIELFIPNWFYQGNENLKWATLSTIIWKLLYFLGILFFIKSSDDFILVPALNYISLFIVGVFNFTILRSKVKTSLRLQPLRYFAFFVRDSFPIFLSNLTQLYTRLNKVLIGVFFSEVAVAWYDIVEKITNMLKLPLTMIAQAAFPRMSLLKDFTLLKRILKYTVIGNLFLIVIVLSFSNFILAYFSTEVIPSYLFNILAIFSFTILPISVNVFYGRLGLFSFGFKKIYTKGIIMASICYALSLILIMLIYGELNIISISVCVLIAETGCCVYYLFYKKLLIIAKS